MASLATWKTTPRVRASLETARRYEADLDAVSATYRAKAVQYRLTIGLNWTAPRLQEGRVLLKYLFAYLDRKTLGGNFLRRPSSARVFGYMIPARKNGGRLHYHGVLGFPSVGTREHEVRKWIDTFLRKEWPLSDCHLDLLDPTRAEEWAGYTLKEEAMPKEKVTSLDFHQPSDRVL